MNDDALLKIIWDYMQVSSLLLEADVIVAGGAIDPGIAITASDLYKQGLAPYILFSGYAQQDTNESEADMLAGIAIENGVPALAIIKEDQASNTGDNILFSAALLKEKGITPQKVILVHKPYMTRRFLATAQKQWPDPQPEFMIAHQDISMEQYWDELGRGEVIRKMLGDFKRIKTYVKKGYQVAQEVPDDVQAAYETLVERGHQVR